MSRRRAAEKRQILPDPKFGDQVVMKFMNSLMVDGKKSAAEGILYGAFDTVESKSKQDPLAVFHEALGNVRPQIEVRSRRVGGATYQVPVEVRSDRRQALATHPDKGGSAEAFRAVVEAFETLGDSNLRAAYDAGGSSEHRGARKRKGSGNPEAPAAATTARRTL